jgi:hypothetical protein
MDHVGGGDEGDIPAGALDVGNAEGDLVVPTSFK